MAVKAGSLPADHAVLREVKGLCSRLPIQTTDIDGGHTVKDTNDVLLIAYLATITKGCSAINDLLSKARLAYSKSSGIRRRQFLG